LTLSTTKKERGGKDIGICSYPGQKILIRAGGRGALGGPHCQTPAAAKKPFIGEESPQRPGGKKGEKKGKKPLFLPTTGKYGRGKKKKGKNRNSFPLTPEKRGESNLLQESKALSEGRGKKRKKKRGLWLRANSRPQGREKYQNSATLLAEGIQTGCFRARTKNPRRRNRLYVRERKKRKVASPSTPEGSFSTS